MAHCTNYREARGAIVTLLIINSIFFLLNGFMYFRTESDWSLFGMVVSMAAVIAGLIDRTREKPE